MYFFLRFFFFFNDTATTEIYTLSLTRRSSDLVERLETARKTAKLPLACARSGDWRHPVVGLWPVRLRDDLRKALTEEDLHKIEVWTARHGVAIADWAAKPVDPFLNVNTPEDVVEAEHIASQHRDI